MTYVDLHGLWRQPLSNLGYFGLGFAEHATYSAVQMGRSFGGMYRKGNEWQPQFFGTRQQYSWRNPSELPHCIGQSMLPYTYDAKSLPDTAPRSMQMRANGSALSEMAGMVLLGKGGYQLLQKGLQWVGWGSGALRGNAATFASRQYAYSGLATPTKTPPVSGGTTLQRHLQYSQDYGQAGVKHLQNGRVRYYGIVDPAKKPGQMIGRRYVHEFGPFTGRSRGWNETLDANFRIRQVRPQLDAKVKKHYFFDSKGNLEKIW